MFKGSSIKSENIIKYAFLEVFIIIILIILDQIVKHIVESNFSFGEVKPLIKGFIGIMYTKNTGAAFSLFSNNIHFLIVIRIVMCIGIVIILVKYHKNLSMIYRICLCLFLAGAIGNLVDQICLGYVRDMFMFLFVNFAIFNVADIFITIGSILFIIKLLLHKEGTTEHQDFISK